METRMVHQTENNGVSIERGPIVYSLPVQAKTTAFPYIGTANIADFPNVLMVPESDWSYAIEAKSGKDIELIKIDKSTSTSYPWDLDATPVGLKVPVRKIENWKITGTHHAPIWPSNLELNNSVDTLKFVPLGTTYLRMTILPKVKNNE